FACAACGLAQTVPALGAGVYQLSFEARGTSGGAALEAALTVPDDAPWSFARRWDLSTEWQRQAAFVWLWNYGEADWELSLRPAGAAGLQVRGLRLEKVDAPDNRLLNPSFDFFDPQAVDPDFSFPPWKTADFWTAARARGAWRAAPGPDGNLALEIGLTGADGPPQRVGLQQNCGSAPAGATVSLQADLNLPADLAGSVARVQAIFFQSGEVGHYAGVGVERRLKTTGWQGLTASGHVPDLAGEYQCMLIVEIDAVGPLRDAAEVARFDAIILTVAP
ncbi:MAG: hypothetical protein ABI847_11560, partial [Anaerolineales bacterium]